MRPKRDCMSNGGYAYFVSMQTVERTPFFRHERWAKLMQSTVERYAESAFVLHAFVIMQDHLHLLVTPSQTIEKSIQMVKGGFSFTARREFEWKGEIWQEGFTDHRIRDEDDWERHIEYIRLNPVRAQLVEDSALYPYMGFPGKDFPQGLRPQNSLGEANVRAKARTLQSVD
jgi:putative transposase